MRTSFFMISSRTDGQLVEISEAQFDELVRMRAQWDLFVAVKGQAVHAVGGEMDDGRREKLRGHKLTPSHAWPLVNLARAKRWLTPSQAGRMTSPSAIPEPVEDSVEGDKYRKALERGRRAVDRKVDTTTRPATWRVVETGDKLESGERLYRFKHAARGDDGEPVRYCVLWCEDRPDTAWFLPHGPGSEKLPLSDGSYGLYQNEAHGLRITVRDAVVNLTTEELVFLVDLTSVNASKPVVLVRVMAGVAGINCTSESFANGARIRASRADVVRSTAAAENGPIGNLMPGQAVHFRCFAFSLANVLGQLEGQTFNAARLVVETGATLERTGIELPVRVIGATDESGVVRCGDGWTVQPGYAEKRRKRSSKALLAALRQMSQPAGNGSAGS